MRPSLRLIVVLIAFMAGVTLYAPQAQAHTPTFYLFGTWQPDAVEVHYGFHVGFPMGDARFRVTDGKNEWNENGNADTPTFFGFLPDLAEGGFGQFCQTEGPPGDEVALHGVYWEDLAALGRPNSLAVTNVWAGGANREIVCVTVSFDSERSWYTGTGPPGEQEFDIWSVASHEFGHVTGFGGHFAETEPVCDPEEPTEPLHTMCPTYPSGAIYNRDLAPHDIHTFQDAYTILAPTGSAPGDG